jgi:hypothetical protein
MRFVKIMMGSLCLWAMLSLGAMPRASAEPLSNAKVIRNFDIVAFGNEYTGRRYKHVRKWKQPIRIGIQGGKYPPYFEAYVKQHIRDIWEITGHPIELYYSHSMHKAKKLAKDFNATKVNFILFYLPTKDIPKAVAKYFDNDEAQVRQMIKVSTCFAKFGTKKNEIKWAISIFPAEHPKDYMRACVVEELTQVLGLPNDSAQVSPSIFNDKSQYFELTEHDRLMLKMLYDPRIPVGMPREAAIAMGKKVLEEIRPGQ